MDHAILLDIEGTIGDISFVRNVLFPYARERMRQTLFAHWHDVEIMTAVDQARALSGQALEAAVAASDLFLEWMDEDKKITPLKTVQGFIWRDGYQRGVLKAHLYPDAVSAFAQWRAQGLRLFIYSSGSVEAQKLYLTFSDAGDMSALFDGFFDTTTGPKTEVSSYSAIASELGVPGERILFFSDMIGEIDAARSAGLGAVRIDRSLPPDMRRTEGGGQVAGSFLPFLQDAHTV